MAKATEYGIKKLRRILLGKETVAGTAVFPTTTWRGTGSFKDLREATRPDEDIGFLVGRNRVYFPMTGCELNLEETPATFEQLPILADSGVATVTPAADGGGTGYISTYTFPYNSATIAAIKTRTAEFGDNQEVDSASYFFTKEINLSGSSKGAVMMSAVMEGRSPEPVVYSASCAFVLATKKITDAALGLAIFTTGMSIRVSGTVSNDGTYTVATGGVAGEIVTTEALATESAVACTIEQVFTAAATVPTVEEMLFGKSKLYLGAVGTAIGSLAQVTNAWLGFTLKASLGKQAKHSGDGRLDLSYVKTVGPEITAEMLLEWNQLSTTERRAAKLGTPRKMRMKFEGTAFATAGTTYTYKTVLIDGCGTWDIPSGLEEQDGDDIVKLNFVYGYDSTAALYHQWTIVNALSAVL